ncbi:MAG: RNA-binding protein [Gammaproteobacteria bacterium]|nr:RNA-binding protein [Gammaproteobacteria bacterium]
MPIGPQGQKRPGNVIANAVHCCRVLVGEAEETYVGKQRNGGQARADKLSPERRSEIAKKAAAARWGTTETTG